MTIRLSPSPQEIVAAVRQSSCTFPPIFSQWPAHPPRCSPHADALVRAADEWIEASLPPGKRRNAYTASQFGLIAAYAHPDAPLERARTLAQWYAFIFASDDPMDQPRMGLASPEGKERLDAWVGECKRWVAHCLGLGRGAADGDAAHAPEEKVIANFRPIGEALRAGWSTAQRERFLRYYVAYLDGCAAETVAQAEQKRSLPTVDEFWKVRMGTAAIWPCAALFQLDDDVELPDEVWEDEDLQRLIVLTTYDTAGRNEGVSLRNELDDEDWHNLVLVMLYHGLASSLQDAIDKLGAWIEARLAEREACAARLVARWGGHAKVKEQLQAYIECHRRFSVALRVWDFRTARYGFVEDEVRRDGTLFMDLTQPPRALQGA